jgi:ElaB/YqjD/DUF883 family membrane-anchored ribosome-binding protein
MEVYFDNLTAKNARLDKLADEVESLVENAEQLVQTGGAALPANERQRLAEVLARLKSTAGQIKVQATKGLKAADRIVREHPYESAGVALALGLLVGVLIGRSRDKES